MVCSECFKVTNDKVETIAKAAKGKARHPAEGYVCSNCLQRILRKASNQAQDKSGSTIRKSGHGI